MSPITLIEKEGASKWKYCVVDIDGVLIGIMRKCEGGFALTYHEKPKVYPTAEKAAVAMISKRISVLTGELESHRKRLRDLNEWIKDNP